MPIGGINMNNDLVSFFEELANRLSGFQWKMDYEEAKYSPEVTSECGGHGIYNGWLRINVWAELSVRGKGKYHWSITAPPQALFPNQPSLQIATRLFSTPKILIHVDQIAKFMQQTDAKYGTLAKEHFGRKLEKLLAKYGYSIPAPEAFKNSYGNTVCIVQEPEWDSEQILKQAPELNLKVTDGGAFEEFVTLEGSGSEVLQKVEEALIKIMPQEEFEDSSFDESFDWGVFGKYAPIENR